MTETVSLKSQIKSLVALQELDLRIDQLKSKKAGLPTALKAFQDVFQKAQTRLNLKKAQMTEIEKLQKQLQAALDINKDRLARSSTRLETVTNSQEYQAVSKELDQLKKQNATLEEQLLKHLTDLETLSKELNEINKDYEKYKVERDAQASLVDQDLGKLNVDLEQLMTERKTYTVLIEQKFSTQYDRIRVARAGLGIVPAIAGRCKGCNMTVPPQLMNEIQRGKEMHQCPSCRRLLYLPDLMEKAEPSTVAAASSNAGS